MQMVSEISTFERTYFDIRISNPHALKEAYQSAISLYGKHDKIMNRAYEQSGMHGYAIELLQIRMLYLGTLYFHYWYVENERL